MMYEFPKEGVSSREIVSALREISKRSSGSDIVVLQLAAVLIDRAEITASRAYEDAARITADRILKNIEVISSLSKGTEYGADADLKAVGHHIERIKQLLADLGPPL